MSIPVTPGNVKKIGIAEGLHIPAVLYRSHPNVWYWYRYLPDSQTLFVQYNRCANDSTHHFGDVAKQAFAEADAHTVKRVVIDLRWNGGGDSRVIGPLKSGLTARGKALGHIYVLIGPGTFSSALDNAMELHKDLAATLVGEPSGGSPDGYGEVATLTLPNSKLVVRFTTKRWGPKGSTTNTTLTPDLPVPFKLAEFIAGHDPALDAAIAAQ
jgi:C-terminal processing protease CtpA/Prc